MVVRKLASIRKIDNIEPIPGADSIEVATVGGWKVVVKKSEFNIGDMIVYFEIDSWIPTDIASFLSKGNEPREYNGIKGERLRTIRLRGQLSQGLILSVANVSHKLIDSELTLGFSDIDNLDITSILNVQKWEMVIPASLAGKAKGNFPSDIRKTDQERCQNLKSELIYARDKHLQFEVTVKMDGSSMTVFTNNEEIGVCSRNLLLQLDQEGNSYVDTAKNSGLLSFLSEYSRNIAVQGELVGPGIQDNIDKLSYVAFYVFDIFDIDKGEYVTSKERLEIVELIKNSKHSCDINHVEIIDNYWSIPVHLKDDEIIPYLLEMAEGKNLANNQREGLVFKQVDGKFTFKAISNKFLLNEK